MIDLWMTRWVSLGEHDGTYRIAGVVDALEVGRLPTALRPSFTYITPKTDLRRVAVVWRCSPRFNSKAPNYFARYLDTFVTSYFAPLPKDLSNECQVIFDRVGCLTPYLPASQEVFDEWVASGEYIYSFLIEKFNVRWRDHNSYPIGWFTNTL
jgi:hypothetical protein